MTQIYYGKKLKTPIVLDQGKVGRTPWITMTLGTHPVGYVGVASDHPFAKLDHEDFHVPVHGGITYGGELDQSAGVTHDVKKYHWFGWDYSHFWDFVDYSKMRNQYLKILSESMEGTRRWTSEELKADAIEAAAFVEARIGYFGITGHVHNTVQMLKWKLESLWGKQK